MVKQVARFGFAISEGENAGLACLGWRVWCQKEDTYITAKSLNGSWKVSLHGDAAWRVAMTSEAVQSGNFPSIGVDRAPWKLTVPSFVDGERLAFVIGVTRSALLPVMVGEADPSETLVEASDSWKKMATVQVWMTEPGVSKESSSLIGKPLTLASGRRVWLHARQEELPAGEPPDSPVRGRLVRVLRPEEDEVTAPGYLVLGYEVSGIPT